MFSRELFSREKAQKTPGKIAVPQLEGAPHYQGRSRVSMDAEERLKTTIKKWEADLIARIQGASESGKADIEKWVAEYIAALHVEIPLSVKQVLDRGGAVRSVVFKGKEINSHFALTLNVDGWSENLYIQEMSLPSGPGNLRITLIFEPTDKVN